MLTGKITGGSETIAKVESLRGAIREELRRSVNLLGADLALLVKQKLSGPVLKTQSGALRRSINVQVEETNTSILATVGTSTDVVPYARIHEFGGIIEPRHGEFLVFKTADGGWHKVRQVVMPERSYLRSSLQEKAPTVEREIKRALQRASARAGFK